MKGRYKRREAKGQPPESLSFYKKLAKNCGVPSTKLSKCKTVKDFIKVMDPYVNKAFLEKVPDNQIRPPF